MRREGELMPRGVGGGVRGLCGGCTCQETGVS